MLTSSLVLFPDVFGTLINTKERWGSCFTTKGYFLNLFKLNLFYRPKYKFSKIIE